MLQKIKNSLAEKVNGRTFTSLIQYHILNTLHTQNTPRCPDAVTFMVLDKPSANGVFSFMESMKNCTKCLQLKLHSKFYKRSDHPHLYQSQCKECICKDRSIKNCYANNPLKQKRDKEYHLKNKDARSLYNKEFNKRTKPERAKRDKERYHSDLNFRITANLRNRIRIAIKRNSKSASTNNLLGCRITFLKEYISLKFTKGMSWDNYGEWQIDHIAPCSSFNLTIPENQFKCFHFSYLQPLWAIDNLIKKDKIINPKTTGGTYRKAHD